MKFGPCTPTMLVVTGTSIIICITPGTGNFTFKGSLGVYHKAVFMTAQWTVINPFMIARFTSIIPTWFKVTAHGSSCNW